MSAHEHHDHEHHHHEHDHGHHHHDHEHDHDHEHHHHDHDHGHEHHLVEMSPEEYVEAYRSAKDEWMREDTSSPLPEEERAGFTGLSYYPFDERYFVIAPLDPNVSPEPITLETSTGDSREYHRAGKIRFSVDGDEAEVTVFQGPDGELFLPMRDATSGKETYGAGRYLEPELLDDGTVLVDFNGLYNPFCAYDERFSCPLPPRENWLSIPISAGEKVMEK